VKLLHIQVMVDLLFLTLCSIRILPTKKASPFAG